MLGNYPRAARLLAAAGGGSDQDMEWATRAPIPKATPNVSATSASTPTASEQASIALEKLEARLAELTTLARQQNTSLEELVERTAPNASGESLQALHAKVVEELQRLEKQPASSTERLAAALEKLVPAFEKSIEEQAKPQKPPKKTAQQFREELTNEAMALRSNPSLLTQLGRLTAQRAGVSDYYDAVTRKRAPEEKGGAKLLDLAKITADRAGVGDYFDLITEHVAKQRAAKAQLAQAGTAAAQAAKAAPPAPAQPDLSAQMAERARTPFEEDIISALKNLGVDAKTAKAASDQVDPQIEDLGTAIKDALKSLNTDSKQTSVRNERASQNLEDSTKALSNATDEIISASKELNNAAKYIEEQSQLSLRERENARQEEFRRRRMQAEGAGGTTIINNLIGKGDGDGKDEGGIMDAITSGLGAAAGSAIVAGAAGVAAVAKRKIGALAKGAAAGLKKGGSWLARNAGKLIPRKYRALVGLAAAGATAYALSDDTEEEARQPQAQPVAAPQPQPQLPVNQAGAPQPGTPAGATPATPATAATPVPAQAPSGGAAATPTEAPGVGTAVALGSTALIANAAGERALSGLRAGAAVGAPANAVATLNVAGKATPVSAAARSAGGGLGKLLGPVATLLSAYATWQTLQDLYGLRQTGAITDEQFKREFSKEIGKLAGGVGGGALLAKLGAIGGGALGSVVPGLGTALGAGAGGVVGGIAGYFAGEAAGEAIGNQIYETFIKGAPLPPPPRAEASQIKLDTPNTSALAAAGATPNPAPPSQMNVPANRPGGYRMTYDQNGRVVGSQAGMAGKLPNNGLSTTLPPEQPLAATIAAPAVSVSQTPLPQPPLTEGESQLGTALGADSTDNAPKLNLGAVIITPAAAQVLGEALGKALVESQEFLDAFAKGAETGSLLGSLFGGGSGGGRGGSGGGAQQGAPYGGGGQGGGSYPGADAPQGAGGQPGAGMQPGIPGRQGGGTLAQNQAEAYQAAREQGLSDTAARALVANLTGEALHKPNIVNQDYNSRGEPVHIARGIAQWDPARSEAIRKQFGKLPNEMTVAEQTRAALWEMQNNPAYRKTWQALQGNDERAMMDALVRNYERPANADRAIAQRMEHYKRLPQNFEQQPGLLQDRAMAKGSVGKLQQISSAAPSIFNNVSASTAISQNRTLAVPSEGGVLDLLSPIREAVNSMIAAFSRNKPEQQPTQPVVINAGGGGQQQGGRPTGPQLGNTNEFNPLLAMINNGMWAG